MISINALRVVIPLILPLGFGFGVGVLIPFDLLYFNPFILD